ncbi:MAG TPA: hypothetical protein VJW20_06700 [Candidatus Angelobacter sp.]|nr:hypothetical protein [Candidatus Angelobacter sp.]
MPLVRPYLPLLLTLTFLFSGAILLHGQNVDVPVEKVFAAVPFEQWATLGPVTEIPWKARVQPYGLSLHQRMRAYIDIELPRRELMNRQPNDRMLALVQVTDAAGEKFRDYVLFRMKDAGAGTKKGEIDLTWAVYVLPGEYQVTLALVDAARDKHNLMQSHTRVDPPKNDPLPGIWLGLPGVEFLTPYMQGPDAMFRPEIKTRLHLPAGLKASGTIRCACRRNGFRSFSRLKRILRSLSCGGFAAA